MTSVRKALLYGVLIWLIAFAVAVVIFPIREANRPLFESIMPVALAGAVVAFGVRYFRTVTAAFVPESLRLGFLWLLISVAIDAPLMLVGGPMKMTVRQYLADIGLTYVLMPVITLGLGLVLAERRPGPAAGSAG
jgi:hypothetical protein